MQFDPSGVHCYRIKISDRFPTEFFMTHRFLQALISSEYLDDLASTPLIEYIVSYRWETWGLYATAWSAALFVVYLLAAMNATFCICSKDYSDCRTTLSHGVSVTAVILINTLYMGISVMQFRMSPGWSFFTNFWNISDICEFHRLFASSTICSH